MSELFLRPPLVRAAETLHCFLFGHKWGGVVNGDARVCGNCLRVCVGKELRQRDWRHEDLDSLRGWLVCRKFRRLGDEPRKETD